MLLTYPAYADERTSYADTYADLIGKLPDTTDFVIVAHNSTRHELDGILARTGASARARIISAPDYLNLLVWARDPFLVRETTTAASSLVEPIEFHRAADALLADILDDGLDVDIVQSPLAIEGGNILVGEDYVVVGGDTLFRTLDVNDRLDHLIIPPATDALAFVADLLRRTLSPDRVMTIAAATVPVRALQPDVDVHRRTGDPGGALPRGRLVPADLPHRHVHRPRWKDTRRDAPPGRRFTGVRRRAIGAAHRSACAVPRFRSRRRSAPRRRLRGDPRPMPITYVDYYDDGVRSWYFATSVNCIVQDDTKLGRHVWLPTYGHGDWPELRVTDEANADVWTRLGFEPHLLGDYHRFAQNLGAVHCLVNELDRG